MGDCGLRRKRPICLKKAFKNDFKLKCNFNKEERRVLSPPLCLCLIRWYSKAKKTELHKVHSSVLFFKGSQFLNNLCVFWRPVLFVIFSAEAELSSKSQEML